MQRFVDVVVTWYDVLVPHLNHAQRVSGCGAPRHCHFVDSMM
jgi:hypothetical protein